MANTFNAVQNLKTYEKALRENYLPVWKDGLTTEPSPLLGKIKQKTLTSDKIVANAKIGLSGGFGFGAEGLATPQAGAVQIEKFMTNSKDLYVNIAISTKAVRLTKSGGAMASALDTEVKGAYETAKWNVGRSLFGNGTGILTVATGANSSDVIPVESTKFLKEGLIVDILTPAGVVVGTDRIKSVDRKENRVQLYNAVETQDKYIITVQNSYNKELTGLGAIFDENVTSLYGVNKSANNVIVPTVVDGNADIDDSVIWDAVEGAETYKNSKIDMIMMGKNAYKHYIEYLRTNNVRVESMTKEITGGFKAIEYAFGNRNIDVVYEQFIPDNEAWCVETDTLELHMQEWDFANLQGGGIFNLMENTSVYRALLANYGDLICTNPGGLVRITNCA